MLEACTTALPAGNLPCPQKAACLYLLCVHTHAHARAHSFPMQYELVPVEMPPTCIFQGALYSSVAVASGTVQRGGLSRASSMCGSAEALVGAGLVTEGLSGVSVAAELDGAVLD